jgi:phosphoserine/homoserine phosphotransferase
MRQRLRILQEHGLKLADIQEVIETLAPMPGAKAFLDDLRASYQVIILSDTFYEFAQPLMKQLAWPTLFCHKLAVDAVGSVTGYQLRQKDPKRQSVKSLHALNYRIFAAGDSYNDTTMLSEADAGFLFRAPDNVIAEFPQYRVTNEYSELRTFIDEAANS